MTEQGEDGGDGRRFEIDADRGVLAAERRREHSRLFGRGDAVNLVL